MTSINDVYANFSEFTRDVEIVVDGTVEKPTSDKKTKSTKSKWKKTEKNKDKSKTKNKKDRADLNTSNRDSQYSVNGKLGIGADLPSLTIDGHERSSTDVVENRRHDHPFLTTIGAEEENSVSSSHHIYEELPGSPNGLGSTSLRLPNQLLVTSNAESADGRVIRTSAHTGDVGEPETDLATDVAEYEPTYPIDVDRVAHARVIRTSPERIKRQFSHPAVESTVNRLPVGSEFRPDDVVGRKMSVDDVIKVTALDARSQTPPSLSAAFSSSDSYGNDIVAATTPTSGFVDGSIYSNCGEDVLGSQLSLALASSTDDQSRLCSRQFGDIVTSSVDGNKDGSRHVETVNVVLRNPVSVATDDDSCNDPGPAYVAMYQYDADDFDYLEVDVEDILTFQAHDVIYFLGEKRGRWMRGQMRNSGEIGWFPSTHVREGISTISLAKPGKYATVSGASEVTSKIAKWHHHQLTEQAYVNFDTDEDFDDESDGNEDTQVKVKYYVALYPYEATHDGDVTFATGDVIRVLAELDSGWWEGTVVSSNQTGFFPGSYVKSVESYDKPRGTESESAIDLSQSYNSQLSLAGKHDDPSSDPVTKLREKKATNRKSTNALSNFFSTLPRRFSYHSPQQLTPSNDRSMVSSSDHEQKRKTKHGKRRPPTLPAQWMVDSAKVTVADLVPNKVETTPVVVQNAASNRNGSKASRGSTSVDVSVQLNKMLSKQQTPTTGSVANRKKGLSAVESQKIEGDQCINNAATLPRDAVTEQTDIVTTIPVGPLGPLAGVFKKNKHLSTESRHLFTGKAKGYPVSKKPVTDRSMSAGVASRIDKPEVVNCTLLQWRSMSTNDLTRLGASVPGDSIPSKGCTPLVVDLSTEKHGQPQLNEIDGVYSQRIILGTNECAKKNITSQPSNGSAVQPSAVKTNKISRSITRTQSFSTQNADVDKVERTMDVKSKQALSPALSDPVPFDVYDKRNGPQSQHSIPSKIHSASRLVAEIRAPEETSKPAPSSNDIEFSTRRKNTGISDVESNGKGDEIEVHGHSTTDRRATTTANHSKPALPPKPTFLHKTRPTVGEVVSTIVHPFDQPTRSIDQCNNAEYVKLKARPDFVAPFAKPPRRRQLNDDAAETATVDASDDVRQAKSKPKPVSIRQDASSVKVTNLSAGESQRRSGISMSMAKGINPGQPLSAVVREMPPTKEKPLPLKPKPKLALCVADFEITT